MPKKSDTTNIPYQLRYVSPHIRDNSNSLAWSPDGTMIASGSDDKTIKIWGVTSGDLIRTFEGHTDSISSIAWSPTGKLIASGSDDATIKIWDFESGKFIHTLRAHTSLVNCVTWSPDGKMIASGSYDSTVIIWDADTGKRIRYLEGHTASVRSVAWSHVGGLIASGSEDNTIRIWSAINGKYVRSFEGHTDLVSSVAWSPDDKHIASASLDKTVKIWNLNSFKLVKTLTDHLYGVNCVTWSTDGNLIASASIDLTIIVWDYKQGNIIHTLDGHFDSVNAVAWSPNGDKIASGSEDKMIIIWDAETGQIESSLEGHFSGIRGVAWSFDGRFLASGADDRTVSVWDSASGDFIRSLEGHNDQISCVAWSPDDNFIASASDDKTIGIWDCATGNLVKYLEGHTAILWTIAWSPDGKMIASGSSDNTVIVWDVASGKPIHTFEGHTSLVRGVTWSPDSKMVASGSYDRTIKVWDVTSGTIIHSIEGHTSLVNNLAWSPDGRMIASVSYDYTVRIWDAGAGKLIRTMEGHVESINCVAWSPDSKMIASGSDDMTVRVWDVETGECTEIFESTNPSYAILNVDFRPAGTVSPVIGLTKLGDPDIIAGVIDDSGIDTGKAASAPASEITQIVSVKIVLVGESSVGKSGLALRLAENRFEDQISTHGMRLWPVEPEVLSPILAAPPGEKREVVIWDLGGQDEYRLVHQLFLHDTTMALMLLDPTRDSHFHDIDEWNIRLKKQLRERKASKILVGAKADVINPALIDRPRIKEIIEKWEMKGFCLTSAKANTGIDELRDAIARMIDWNDVARISRPRLFQRIRETIDQLRRKGEVLLRYSELEKLIQELEPDEYSPGAVNTVVESLARQGSITVSKMSTGERALILQIGYVEIYAASLVRIARAKSDEGGVPSIELSGEIFKLSMPGIDGKDRLPAQQEIAVIDCVIQLMIESGLCLKHERQLIFPTLFPEVAATQDEIVKHSVSLYYDFAGAIDNIYAALVAQLAAGGKFGRVRLWKDRAEFNRAGNDVCGLQRVDKPGGWSHLDLLFGDETARETRDLFTVFVEDHLQKEGVETFEKLEIVCGVCGAKYGEEVVKYFITRGETEIVCTNCKTRLPISEGASKTRTGSPAVAKALIALKEEIEVNKRRDIEDARREVKSVKVFISYAKEDEKLRLDLDKHLAALKRTGIIETWNDREIIAGQEFKGEIDRNIESARVILLLVSADFIASDYCINTEMHRALQRHAAKEARVIPVIVRPVFWEGLPFSKLAPLPADGKAIMSWGNRDEAFVEVARGVRAAVEELLSPSAGSGSEIATMLTGSPDMPVVEPTPIRILHLSDLHFNQDSEPIVELQPLVRDIKDGKGGLGFDKLDYLVISGDLTNRASIEEFERAREFISGLIDQFGLSSARCIIVPGNHDLNWDVDVYEFQQKRKVDPKQLKEGSYVEQDQVYLIRDDAIYPKRFENFDRFYHQLMQKPYTLKPETQCQTFSFDEHRIQFLTFNSAWETDEYFQNRSSINKGALSNGLLNAATQIGLWKQDGRMEKEASPLRIAVWHHAVPGKERTFKDAFLGQLQQEEIKLCLHGHVNENDADLIGYMHPTRKIYTAGAGSFGPPVNDRPESTPRLYNVIEVSRDHSRIRIHTRCMKKEGGAWEGWANWPGEKATERRTFYDIRL